MREHSSNRSHKTMWKGKRSERIGVLHTTVSMRTVGGNFIKPKRTPKKTTPKSKPWFIIYDGEQYDKWKSMSPAERKKYRGAWYD